MSIRCASYLERFADICFSCITLQPAALVGGVLAVALALSVFMSNLEPESAVPTSTSIVQDEQVVVVPSSSDTNTPPADTPIAERKKEEAIKKTDAEETVRDESKTVELPVVGSDQEKANPSFEPVERSPSTDELQATGSIGTDPPVALTDGSIFSKVSKLDASNSKIDEKKSDEATSTEENTVFKTDTTSGDVSASNLGNFPSFGMARLQGDFNVPRLPKIGLPTFDIPSNAKIEIPSMEIPKLPALPFPDKDVTSAVELPKLELPKFALPELELPKFALPKLDLPKFTLPQLDDFDLPKLDRILPTGGTNVNGLDPLLIGAGASLRSACLEPWWLAWRKAAKVPRQVLRPPHLRLRHRQSLHLPHLFHPNHIVCPVLVQNPDRK